MYAARGKRRSYFGQSNLMRKGCYKSGAWKGSRKGRRNRGPSKKAIQRERGGGRRSAS